MTPTTRLSGLLVELSLSGTQLRPPLPPVTLLTGPPSLLAPGALHLAAAAIPPRFHDHDLRVCSPEGERWRAAELHSALLDALTHLPRGDFALVVLTTAATLDPASTDRMLVSLETPPPGTAFLLTAPSVAALPPPLRGRVVSEIVLAPPPGTAVAAVAHSAGLSADLLTAALPLLLDSPSALAAVDRDQGVLVGVAALAGVDPSTSSAADAVVVAEHLRTISAALSDPPAARRVADAVFTLFESSLRRGLAHHPEESVLALETVLRARAAVAAGAEMAAAFAAVFSAARRALVR